ncbi:hypothetical protein [Vibrio vulnificus]
MIRQTPVNKACPRAFQPAQRVGRVTLFPLFELIKQVLKCSLELLVLSNVDAFFLGRLDRRFDIIRSDSGKVTEQGELVFYHANRYL